MEFRQLLLCAGTALLLTALIVNSSPVIYLEKNGGGRTAHSEVNVGTPWQSCSDPADPVNISVVTVTPMPPKRGQYMSISANISLGENVTNGTFSFELKYGIVTIMKNSSGLCDAVKFSGEKCPMKKGVHILGIGFLVPYDLLTGHYTGTVNAMDQNNKELFCMTLDFQI